MCGIVSILSRQAPNDVKSISAAIETLVHRGPERTGCWHAPDGRVSLAHARLSIIDLATGDQPIVSPRGNVIVANGEIYGHRRLREQLRNAGWRFTTESDSEVALALYERHGLDFVHHLRGEFALTLWDRENQRMVSVRDRFGIKPLYYHEDGERLMLASEAKALFAAGVAPALDRDNFVQHLLLVKPQGASLFAGVRQVPPGCMLVASAGRTVLRRYWDLDYPTHPSWNLDAASQARAAEELADHVADAVQVRLDADVPMGHYLSGGLDSSAVLGVAAKRLGKRLTAFNVRFDHQDYDENAIARETAEFAGVELRTLPMDAGDFASHLERTVWHAESVGINANAVARMLQSKAVHEAGFKAVLSGDGADELFYGYNFHQLDHLLSTFAGDERQRHAHFEQARGADPLSSALPATWKLAANPYASTLMGATPSWMGIVLGNRRMLQDRLLHPDLRHRTTPDQLVERLLEGTPVREQLEGRHPVQQAMYLWCKSVLCNQILFADRLDMAHSVEVRMPLLDHRLFEFARGLPVSWFFRPREEKSLFRDAMKPWLTERVHRQVKTPFAAPPSTLQRGGRLFGLVQDVIHSPELRELGLFDQPELMRLGDSIGARRPEELAALDAPLMLILTSYFLCRQFKLSA